MMDSKSIAQALDGFFKNAPSPVFLAGLDGGRLTLHAARGAPRAEMARAAKRALAERGIALDVRVRAHGERRLTRPKSLERFAAAFAHEAIVHDPTATIGRALSLLKAADDTRAALPGLIQAVFLDPVRRILFVVMPTNEDSDALLATSARIQDDLGAAVGRAAAASGSPFNKPPIQVRAITALPERILVALDRQALRYAARERRGRLLRKVAGGMAAALGLGALAGTAAAQGGPAVSGVNGKLDLRGGYTKSVEGGVNGGVLAGSGSVTMPIGRSFGVQLDGAVGSVDKELYLGGGGHLFWRDPQRGLIGVTGQYGTLDKADLVRAAGRGEYFFQSATIGGFAGYQWGNNGKSVRVKDGFIGGVDLTFYATDNFAIRGAGGVEAGKAFGRGGLEFQPGFASLPGLSVFADGGAGGGKQVFALAGVRYYFGDNKSLKRRHREDDPVALPLAEIGQYRKFNKASTATPPGGGYEDD